MRASVPVVLAQVDSAALAQSGGDQPRHARLAARAVHVNPDADALQRFLVQRVFDDGRDDQHHGDRDQELRRRQHRGLSSETKAYEVSTTFF